jgi:hypothetical protein
MRAFDRSQRIVELGGRFDAGRRIRDRDDEPAWSVLTQPTDIEFVGHHLLQRPDIDAAQRR